MCGASFLFTKTILRVRNVFVNFIGYSVVDNGNVDFIKGLKKGNRSVVRQVLSVTFLEDACDICSR